MSGDPMIRAGRVHGAGEPERRWLAALRESGLLDSTSEEAFGRLTRLASRLCDAPIARVSLVDSGRQVFESAIGPLPPSGRQPPLSHAICRHVAFTDVVMPDMRGTELATRLKAQRPGLKIPLSSGYSADALRDDASRPTESRFLVKPFPRTDLLQSLRNLLDPNLTARTVPPGPTAPEAR
jgi:CheY-like chemotaxis protein